MKKRENASVGKAFSMVLQFGLSLMVPTLLLLLIGTRLDAWRGTGYWTPLLLLLGMAAGVRNCWLLARSFFAKELSAENEEAEKQRQAEAAREMEYLARKAEREAELAAWREHEANAVSFTGRAESVQESGAGDRGRCGRDGGGD